ncbi:MAG: MCE family protein [Gammaproteobacteria bacterium]|nr:MCE family protein [Gammaproteobacteria bacterium]
METKFSHFIVGLFVISLTCALIIMGAWLFAKGKGHSYEPYLVYMNESVSGLNLNSPVKYNGVDVGYVAEIGLDKRNPQWVRLLLHIETGTPINTATRATMMTQGLTGIGYIGLKMDSKHATPLHTTPGDKYPVIKSAPSLFLRLDTSVSKLVQSLETISQSIGELLTTQNRKAISNTILNFDHITTTLAKHDAAFERDIQSLGILLHNSAQSSQELTPLISKLNDSATSIENLTQRLADNPAILLRGQQPAPLGPGE